MPLLFVQLWKYQAVSSFKTDILPLRPQPTGTIPDLEHWSYVPWFRFIVESPVSEKKHGELEISQHICTVMQVGISNFYLSGDPVDHLTSPHHLTHSNNPREYSIGQQQQKTSLFEFPYSSSSCDTSESEKSSAMPKDWHSKGIIWAETVSKTDSPWSRRKHLLQLWVTLIYGRTLFSDHVILISMVFFLKGADNPPVYQVPEVLPRKLVLAGVANQTACSE